MINYLACTRHQTSVRRATWDRLRRCICALFVLISLLPSGKQVRAQKDAQDVESPIVLDYREYDTSDAGIPHPGAIAYSYDADLFFLLQPVTQTQYGLFAITPYEHAIESITLDITSSGPFHMALDGWKERLLLLTPDELLEIPIGWNGALTPGADPIHHTLEGWPLDQAKGITVDLTTGHLFILNGLTRTVVEMAPDTEGNFSNAQLVSTTTLDLPAGVLPSGLTRNDTTGHFYTLSNSGGVVYELANSGALQHIYSLAGVNLANPQAVVLAPTADNTDDPDALDLFVLDSKPLNARSPAGKSPVAPQSDAGINAGTEHLFLPSISGLGPVTTSARGTSNRIFELFLTPRGVVRTSATTITATLVHTTNTSAFSPPSPDPSGIAYITHANSLFVSDGEVDEMSIFEGDNLFEATLDGALADSYSSIVSTDHKPNKEPAGVAYAPSGFFFTNPHLFISDDTKGAWITVIDLGADHKYGTADDLRSQFSGTDFGSVDPEGLAYDTSNNALFIVNGVGAEVYRVAPGSNGRFDGVAPGGDDQVTHFDVATLGIVDPEGIEFNPANGHLFIMDRIHDLIAETLLDGTFVQYIDISAANSLAVAGLTYAPSSTNPAQMHLYIVDRGVDNGQDPNENDGKMYEMSFSIDNHAPIAADDGYSINEDETLSLAASGLLSNDTDAESNVLTAVKVTDPAYGALTINADGSFIYTPVLNYNGSDSFTYKVNDGSADSNVATVTITIQPVNDAPVATSDSRDMVENSVLTVVAPGVLENDSDVDSLGLTAILMSDPVQGTLTLDADGSFIYTPVLNFSGIDSFTYKATDGSADSSIATVTIRVNASGVTTFLPRIEE